VPGSEGRWLDADDARRLRVLRELRRTVPQDGTSLENASPGPGAVPRPDNHLVTDGLPTQGASPPAVKRTIDGDGA